MSGKDTAHRGHLNSCSSREKHITYLNPQTQRNHGQGLPEEFLSGFGDKVLFCGSGWAIIHSIPPVSALSTGILGMSHHAQYSQLERNCLLNKDIYEYLLLETHREGPSELFTYSLRHTGIVTEALTEHPGGSAHSNAQALAALVIVTKHKNCLPRLRQVHKLCLQLVFIHLTLFLIENKNF